MMSNNREKLDRLEQVVDKLYGVQVDVSNIDFSVLELVGVKWAGVARDSFREKYEEVKKKFEQLPFQIEDMTSEYSLKMNGLSLEE